MNNCYLPLQFIKWDKQKLIDIMRSYGQNRWLAEDGYINKYLRPDMNEVFEDLYRQLPDFEINIGRTFFAELSPKTYLRPHIDKFRKASINFPLIGDWKRTPVKFHSEKSSKPEHLICEHFYDSDHPTIINTTVYHSVLNPTDETRYMLSLSVYEDWDKIKLCVA